MTVIVVVFGIVKYKLFNKRFEIQKFINSNEGGVWCSSPPSGDSGGGGDESSNSKGEFHCEVELVCLFFNCNIF